MQSKNKFSDLLVSFIILHVCVLITCCSSKKDKEKLNLNEKVLTLSAYDSVKLKWTEMEQEDDLKIMYIKRLIKEISYIPTSNPIEIENLLIKTNQLSKLRYTFKNLSKSSEIDSYDLSVDSLLREIRILVSNTKGVEKYPLCEELTNDIIALDQNVVVRRMRYDEKAKIFNSLFAKVDFQPNDTLRKLTLFQIEE